MLGATFWQKVVIISGAHDYLITLLFKKFKKY